jgi:hypothetical protein
VKRGPPGGVPRVDIATSVDQHARGIGITVDGGVMKCRTSIAVGFVDIIAPIKSHPKGSEITTKYRGDRLRLPTTSLHGFCSYLWLRFEDGSSSW